jgi:DNA-directed RNA polymerase subunit RPC12/RpoP
MYRTVRCFACGEEIRVADENTDAELRCPACGKRVSLLSLDEAPPASELTDQIRATPPEECRYEDHFRALQPLRPITLSLGEPAYGIEVAEEELRAFVGPKASSYVGDWMSVLEGRKKRPAFNAIAFFFAGLWLPYRKLYGATAVFLGVLLVVNAMEMVVDMTTAHSPAQQTVIASLGWGVAIIGWFICGCFANQWYLSRAIRIINDVRSRHLDEEEHLKQIAKRGGTSLGSSIGIFVGFIALNFAMASVAEMIYAPMAMGQKIMFNGGELYHTSSVSEPEARKLGEYLVKSGFFDGSPKSVQITRSNGTIQ